MKPKIAGELPERDSTSIFRIIGKFIVYSALMVVAFSALLAILAICVVQRLMASVMVMLAGSLTIFATRCFELLSVAAYAIWLLLGGHWGQFLCLMPQVEESLRSVGLL
jgi:hypothetical protein